MRFSEAIQKQVDQSGARVRIGYPRWLRPFLGGYIAITLGRTIYLAPQLLERGQHALDRTLRHELAHVRQILRMGLVRFYLGYVKEYLRLRFANMSHLQAYEAISFEREARAAEKEGSLV